MRIALVTLMIVSAAFTSAAPVQAKTDKRMEAIQLCANKAVEDLGDSKVRVLRTKKLRGGYRISIVKMDAADVKDEQARIKCDVRDGSIDAFDVKRKA